MLWNSPGCTGKPRSFTPRLETLEDRVVLNVAPVLTLPASFAQSVEGQGVSIQIEASDADLDSLNYSSSNLPGGLSLNASTGLLSGTLDYRNASLGATAFLAVVVNVDDGQGGSVSGTVSWEIVDVPLLSTAYFLEASEGSSASLSTALGATNGLSYSASGLPSGLTVNPSTGVIGGLVGYNNASGSTESLVGTVSVADALGLLQSSPVTFAINDTNRLPTLSTGLSSTEGQSVSVNFQASDNTGTNSLTYSASGLPEGVSINPSSGLIGGVPGYRNASLGQTASFNATVTLSDDHGGSDTRTLLVTVSDAPVILANSWSVAEGDSLALALATAPGAFVSLSYSSSNLPWALTMSPSTGLIYSHMGYQHASLGATATLTASVTVSDSLGLLESGPVTFTIADSNRLPILPTQPAAIGQTVSVSAEATDNTGSNTLTYSSSGLPDGLSINSSTGLITGTVAPGTAPAGSASYYPYTLTLTDNHGGSDTRTLSWVISNPTFSWSQSAPPAPSITSISNQTSDEGDTISLALSASAPGTLSLRYGAVNLPEGLSIDPSTGLISGTIDYFAAQYFEGTYEAVVVAVNALGGQGSASFTWTVSDTPRAPTVSAVAGQSSNRGDSVSLQVVAADPDNDWLYYDASGLPSGLWIDPDTGLIEGVLAPWSAEDSPYAVTVSVDDGTTTAVSVAFNWDVALGSNNAPALESIDAQSSAVGDDVYLALPGDDTDDDALTFTASGLPQGLSLDPFTGEIYGTIANAAASTEAHSVTVVLSDGQTSASRTFLWAVGFVGLGNPGEQFGVLGDTISLELTAQAASGSLSYNATGLPSGLSLDASSGLISGILSGAGDSTVTLTASDGSHSATQSFTWSVAALALHDPGLLQGTAGSSVSLQLAATAPSSTPTYSVEGLPDGLSLNTSTGLITGTLGLSAFQSSPHKVTLGVSDGSESDELTFLWVVRPRVALSNPGAQLDAQGESVSLALTGFTSGGTLTYSASGLPTGLSINPSTGLITGTLGTATAQAEPYAVTLTADDGTAQNSVTFAWSVAELVLDVPEDQSDLDAESVSVALAAHYHGTGSLAFSASGLPEGVSINASTGLISGTLDENAEQDSPYDVTVSVNDGSNTASHTFAWDVQARLLLDTPGDQNDVGGDTVSLNILADAAEESVTLTYSASGLPSGLSIDSSTGLITGTIASGAVSASPASVTLGVGYGSHSVSETFLWTIAPLGLEDPLFVSGVRNQSVSYALEGRAANGAGLTYSASGLPVGLSIDSSTGLIAGTPATLGAYLVAVTASQGTHAVSHTFEWDILQAGLSNPGDQEDTEGDAVSLTLQGASGSSASLTYGVSGLPDGLSLNPSTGLITGTLAAGTAADGPFLVTAVVSDGTASNQQQFTWTASPFIELTALDDQESVEGDSVSLSVSATSAGTASLTYSAEGLPDGLSINVSTGLISGTVAAGAALDGTSDVTVTVSDGTYSSEWTFWWWVVPSTPPANPVVSSPGSQTNRIGDLVVLPVQASDAAGYSLTFDAVGLPDGLSIDPSTGVISGVVKLDAADIPYSVTVTAYDGVGGSDSETFLWLIDSSPISVQVSDFDAEAGTLTDWITVATFTTPELLSEAEDFYALIEWGDGTSDQGVVDGEDGTFTVSGEHAYEEDGAFILSLTVLNMSSGVSATASGTATVSAAPWTVEGDFQQGAVAGQSATLLVGIVEDDDPNVTEGAFSVEIDPGDGSAPVAGVVTALGPGTWSVSLPYTYTQTGIYTAEFTVTGPGGAQLMEQSVVVVGELYAGVEADLTVAQFAVGDPGAVPEDYTATIYWGDGQNSPGTVSGTAGVFTVEGSYDYPVDSFDEPSGSYQVTVVLSRDSQAVLTATHSVIIVRPQITAHPDEVLVEESGEVIDQVLAMFEVPSISDEAEDFAADVDWGDGTGIDTTASVVGSDGLFYVIGSHSYATVDLYTVTVTLSQSWSALLPSQQVVTTAYWKAAPPNLITFRNAKLAVPAELAVGKWEKAFTRNSIDDPVERKDIPVKPNFIDLDEDRFYVQVNDPTAKGKGTITVKLHTSNVVAKKMDPNKTYANNTAYNEKPIEVALTETAKNSGVFRSKSLLLVSDSVDDKYKVDNVQDNQKGDRTFMIALDGKVVVTYRNRTAEIKVPAKKRVNVVVHILKDKAGGDALITEDQVKAKVQVARERYAQLGIDVTYQIVAAVNPPPNADLSDGYQVRLEDHDAAKLGPLSKEEKAILGLAARKKNSKDIHVFFVNRIITSAKVGGNFYTPGLPGYAYDEVETPIPYGQIVLGVQPYLSKKFGEKEPSMHPTTLAHEVGHMLQPPRKKVGDPVHSEIKTDLMYGSDYGSETLLQDTKRLTRKEAKEFEKSKYLQPPLDLP